MLLPLVLAALLTAPVPDMNNPNHRLPTLVVPESYPSPTGSSIVQTGRPSLWTQSHERQLVRLYVYTTLSLRTIIDIIFRGQDTKPGYEANPECLEAVELTYDADQTRQIRSLTRFLEKNHDGFTLEGIAT